MILNKKDLAARALKVGKERIKFVRVRLDEIKDAITKQDIRDLVNDGAIVIKPIKGRRKNKKRKNKRGVGKIKKKVNKRKKNYVKMTRKLRKYVKHLKKQGEISLEESKKIRKEIRNKTFKSKENLRLNIKGMKK